MSIKNNKIEITTFDYKYKSAFKDLNEEWIRQYFVMEDLDYQELGNPKEYVIDKGGEILVALYDDIPVGVCALVKMDDPDYDFELSKLAVSPKAQGKGIGELLVKGIIQLAKEKGADKLFIQSNTALTPAINLYYKLGFKEITRPSPQYDRVDIQMELNLR